VEEKLDFQQLVEYSLNPTIVIDNNIVIYINKACLELLGLHRKEQIIGDDFHNYLHSDFYNVCSERMKRIVEKEEPIELVEQKLVRADGQTIDVEVMAAPFRFENRILVQANYRDITERKQTHHILMQSEKLSAIGELTAGILHEIRNPLTAIKGFLQFIGAGNFKKDYIDVIRSEVDSIEKIANELLFFSKPQKEQFQPVNIIDITREALFLFETEAFKKKIDIQFIIENESLRVSGNKTQLKQALINLIKNAIEATSKHGKIYIKIKKDANNVSIIIKDNGIGIPQEKLKNLGQSFFSTKEKGTGLGLMVTYNIIKNHHGQIIVHSKQNDGTTFITKLPHININENLNDHNVKK
jgi:two-component system sporulation sensor kinase A